MRVAFFAHRFPTTSETFVARQVAGVRALGHDVHVFALRPGDGPPPVPATLLRPRRLRRLEARWRRAALRRRRGAFDIAHAHFGPTALDVREAGALWGVPLVASLHGYDVGSFPRRHGPGIYAPLFAVAAAVTVNSRHTWRRAVALGCPQERLRLLPMGVDLDAHRPSPPPAEGFRVLTVARLVEKKGVADVLEAMARLRAAHPAARYDVVGDGPLRAELQARAQALGLRGAVTFHGARAAGDVARMLAACHVLVLASLTAADGDQEGQGLVLAEAQAAARPVVATDHGGLPESLLPGETGLLVPERDPEALAAALGRLAGDPALRRRMGERGRAFVQERFDARALDARLVALYEELVAAHRRSEGDGRDDAGT